MAVRIRKARMVVGVAAVVAAVVTVVIVLVLAQPHGARIVDCVSGYHNASGPSSDCVRDSSPAAP